MNLLPIEKKVRLIKCQSCSPLLFLPPSPHIYSWISSLGASQVLGSPKERSMWKATTFLASKEQRTKDHTPAAGE